MPRSAFARHARTLDGLQSYCRRCTKEHQGQYYAQNPDKHAQRKQRQSERRRDYSPEKKVAVRLRELLRRHRLTEEELVSLYEACGHRCQVCGLHASQNMWKKLANQLCIDHIVVDAQRIVRGLLCNRCNTLLGRMGNERAGVMRYIDYLENYRARKEGPNGRV